MLIKTLKSKKKLIISSICLILLGFIISFVGFAILNFDLSKFDTCGEFQWYRIVHFGNHTP